MEDKTKNNSDYIPVIIQLDTHDDININPDIYLENTICQSLLSLGFTSNVHMCKNKLELPMMTKQKDKKYLVTNKFEHVIHGNNKKENINDIETLTSNFFEINTKDVMFNRAFVKIYEMIVMFDLIPLNLSNFTSVHLAESPGSFFQCSILYRDKFGKKNISKNDKYHCISIYSENSNVPSFSKNMTDYYENEKPVRLFIHKTYPLKETINNNKDNGDLTNPKTITNFSNEIKNKAHFITADGGFDTNNENLQEQETFVLVLGQIVAAITIQEHDGHFVLKIFESYTILLAKLMYILCGLYKEVYIMKPLTSRKSNSEKYIICKFFKYGKKKSQHDNIQKTLFEYLEKIFENKNLYVHNFSSNIIIPQNMLNLISTINNEIYVRQYESINEYVSFVKNNKQFTDEFNKYINEQKNAAQYWASIYLVNNYTKIYEMKKNIISFFNNISKSLI